MADSSLHTTNSPGVPRIGLAAWLRLRRTPHPDFVSSLQELPTSLSELAALSLSPNEPFHGALLLPPEYYPRKMLAWEYVPDAP